MGMSKDGNAAAAAGMHWWGALHSGSFGGGFTGELSNPASGLCGSGPMVGLDDP